MYTSGLSEKKAVIKSYQEHISKCNKCKKILLKKVKIELDEKSIPEDHACSITKFLPEVKQELSNEMHSKRTFSQGLAKIITDLEHEFNPMEPEQERPRYEINSKPRDNIFNKIAGWFSWLDKGFALKMFAINLVGASSLICINNLPITPRQQEEIIVQEASPIIQASLPKTENPIIQSPQRGEEEIIVQWGDTLGKIAKKYLGDEEKYLDIANYNNIKNPNLIRCGDKLKIPKLSNQPALEILVKNETPAKSESTQEYKAESHTKSIYDILPTKEYKNLVVSNVNTMRKVAASFEVIERRVDYDSIKNPELSAFIDSYANAKFKSSGRINAGDLEYDIKEVANTYNKYGAVEVYDTYSYINKSNINVALNCARKLGVVFEKTRLSMLSKDEISIIKNIYQESKTNKEAIAKIRDITGMKNMSISSMYRIVNKA
jgi:LysM repeat protein